MIPSILKAMEFAERKHIGQARDDGQDFYSGHCLVVYQTVKSRRGDAETLCAALLHDTIEDTDTTYEELVENFGKNVADLVLMVTHTEDNVFPKLKFTDGKYSELVHKAMVIKHADTFVNVSEMYTWTPEQRMKYLNKKMCWRNESNMTLFRKSSSESWGWIIHLQDVMHPDWRHKMPRSIFTTGLASEIGGVCDQVTHLDGGGSQLLDPEKWNEAKLLHDLVDSWAMIVLVAEHSGFTESDFWEEWLKVRDELMERTKARNGSMPQLETNDHGKEHN